MTVHIENVSGTGGGWSEYTLGKSNDREHATLICGNTLMGDNLIEDIEYKSGNYVRMVVSFAKEDNVSVEQGDSITKEFVENYMYGYSSDEYHVDIVRHEDTDQLHYHVRFPKINLLTNTQLKVYWHKSDLNYVKATITDIAYKYNLIIGLDKRKLTKDPLEKKKRIKKWREQHEHKQKDLDFTTKKSREIAELQLTDHIADAVQSGILTNLDAVKAELLALGLKVTNEGFDMPKSFHYLTVMKGDNKLRLKGDIYDRRFYKLDRETKTEKISSNTSLTARNRGDRTDGKQIAIDLRRERNKRLKFIDRQYQSGRKRAIRKILEDSQGITLEQSKTAQTVTQISSTWSISPGRDYRYLDNTIHNKIKADYDSIGTKIIDSTRKRAERKRKRAESIARINAIITRRAKDSIQPTKQDYRIIAERRRGRKLFRAVIKNIGSVVHELTTELKRGVSNFIKEALALQSQDEKSLSNKNMEESEKETQIILPTSDMTAGYNHVNSKNEEVTIKTSHK